ncbi:RNA polymerase II mediator complex subunit [Mycoblastus sanguinarius]|nr:RNA polymerase II mediator complex subunit [Mycoblastus sanguinarius]
MADRLTQLQDCYDQLATQFYSSIRYISAHHSSAPLLAPPLPTTHNNQNNSASNHQSPPSQQQEQSDADAASYPPEQRPDSPAVFAAAQRELAQDLLIKTKQIEYIISVLPGVENSQEKQEGRIKELEIELQGALEERKKAEQQRQIWLAKVEGIIGGVRR